MATRPDARGRLCNGRPIGTAHVHEPDRPADAGEQQVVHARLHGAMERGLVQAWKEHAVEGQPFALVVGHQSGQGRRRVDRLAEPLHAHLDAGLVEALRESVHLALLREQDGDGIAIGQWRQPEDDDSDTGQPGRSLACFGGVVESPRRYLTPPAVGWRFFGASRVPHVNNGDLETDAFFADHLKGE